MSSLKCPQCGLTNFATSPACKRCKTPFDNEAGRALAAQQQVQQVHEQAQQPAAGFYEPEHTHYNLDYAKSVWRDGQQLVMTKETILPNRCVKCNAPAMKLLRRTVEWYPPYVVLVFIFVHIVGLILYLCTRKRVTVYVGLCESHINRRRMGILAGCVVFLMGMFSFFGSVAGNVVNPGYIFVGLMLVLAGIVVMISSYRTVTATKIKEPYVWLKGLHRDFLEQLPPA
jgi:hypothetical protein